MITRRFLELQIARLLRKHSALDGVSFETVSLSEAPLPEISEFITGAWVRAFGTRPSISFSPEFLRFHCGEASNPGSATLAYRDEELCGTLLGFPFDFVHGEENLAASLFTGLCTAPEFEGEGMVEMLLARQAVHLVDSGQALSLHWRSSKEGTGKGSARSGLVHAVRVPLYAKALDCARAAKLGKLGLLERLGIRGLRFVYPLGRRLPRGFEVEPYTTDNLQECAAFFAEFHSGASLVRHLTQAELARRLGHRDGEFQASSLLLRHHGRLRGVLYGYRNPVGTGDAFFSLDGALFHPGLTFSENRAFLAQFEALAQKEWGCFAILVPGSVCRLPLRQCGYLPVKHYLFGAAGYPGAPELEAADIAGLSVELR